MFREEFYTNYLEISIHPPREGWDYNSCAYVARYMLFQSTHPVRGGTVFMHTLVAMQIEFQSTHPVRGGTMAVLMDAAPYFISIHPPREGWDRRYHSVHYRERDFNPPTP